jgi:hypothetical protein
VKSDPLTRATEVPAPHALGLEGREREGRQRGGRPC